MRLAPTLAVLGLLFASPAAVSAQSDRLHETRHCGEPACVIRILRGHAVEAHEYEVLIQAYEEAGGHDRELESAMRTYLTRFPSGRHAARYRMRRRDEVWR